MPPSLHYTKAASWACILVSITVLKIQVSSAASTPPLCLIRLRPSAGCLGCECTNPPIGQALTGDALKREVGALVVIDAERHAVAVTEVELGKVALQVLRTAMLVDAAHPALEDAEKALNRVGVDGAVTLADILANAVIDRLVTTSERLAGELIEASFVGQ